MIIMENGILKTWDGQEVLPAFLKSLKQKLFYAPNMSLGVNSFFQIARDAANKLKDANEATAYNGLIAVWSELTAQAANIKDEDLRGDAQMRMI